jgi:small subunit ribosomal protein S21
MKRQNSFNGSKVIVGDMPIAVALRKFKQKIDDSGKLEDYKASMFFEKPTTTRKRKKGAAKSRWRKKLQEQALPKKLY